MPSDELGKTREAVSDAFYGTEPRRAGANRGKKGGQDRRCRFVAPVAKQTGEADTEDCAVEPGLFFWGVGHGEQFTVDCSQLIVQKK